MGGICYKMSFIPGFRKTAKNIIIFHLYPKEQTAIPPSPFYISEQTYLNLSPQNQETKKLHAEYFKMIIIILISISLLKISIKVSKAKLSTSSSRPELVRTHWVFIAVGKHGTLQGEEEKEVRL